MLEFKFTTYEETDDGDDEEVISVLPGKHEVCGRCEGHGTHLNPNIGEHAYTPEEFAESFDEEEAGEYFRRGGIYDVMCEECEGRRVVVEPDLERCTPEQRKAYEKWCDAEYAYAAERAAELRYGY